MTCPGCDKPGMAFKVAPAREPPAWYQCQNCAMFFDDPRASVGELLFDELRIQHSMAVKENSQSRKIRRGYQIRDWRTGGQRLLTWIEIGAITGAI